MAKSFSEILGAEIIRVQKLVNFAEAGDNPVVALHMLMALNSLKVAEFSSLEDEKTPKRLRTWDKSALLAQYVN